MLRFSLLCLGAAATLMVAAVSMSSNAAPAAPTANPFAEPSPLPLQAPPFDRIKDSDYQPAFEEDAAAVRAGYDDVRVYYLSFADWARDESCPIVRD